MAHLNTPNYQLQWLLISFIRCNTCTLYGTCTCKYIAAHGCESLLSVKVHMAINNNNFIIIIIM